MMSDLMTADLMANLLYLTEFPLLCYQNLIVFEPSGSLDLSLEQLAYITRAFTPCLDTEKFFVHNLK